MLPSDSYAFIGDPPMIRPDADEVHISVTFSWDIKEAERLLQAWLQYYPVVKLGGVAFGDPCGEFTPGLYVKPGVVFTSRGCDNQCPWCEVWKREGRIRELTIVHEGNIIQDNNLLQCSQAHLDRVFAMLGWQHNIQFSGGLDSRLMTTDLADDLRSLSIGQVFFAADTKGAIEPLRRAIKILGLERQKVRCYVLVKFNPDEAISEATERMEEVWRAGAMPFAQLFQPKDKWIDYSGEWQRFARAWSRPPIMKAIAGGLSLRR